VAAPQQLQLSPASACASHSCAAGIKTARIARCLNGGAGRRFEQCGKQVFCKITHHHAPDQIDINWRRSMRFQSRPETIPQLPASFGRRQRGVGTRLGNSIRLASFPKSGDSLNAAALVWSNAPVIIGAHDTGPLIRSKDRFWLAIPTPAAGKSTKGGRITPGEWERRTGLRLRFIYRGRGPSLLVAEGRLNSKGRAVASRSKTGRGLATVPVFLLVQQVKLRKRLDLARDAEQAVEGLPGRLVASWNGELLAHDFVAGAAERVLCGLANGKGRRGNHWRQQALEALARVWQFS